MKQYERIHGRTKQMSNTYHALLIIAVVAAVTIAIRFAPFLVFRGKTPSVILYLGEVLPYSIMAMLVVYCLKGTDFAGAAHGIPEVISVLIVILLHKWKHNTLLSILGGTVAYMVFVQMVFVV